MDNPELNIGQLNSMVEEVEDYAILLLDVEGNIMSWNKGAEKIKGYTTEEITGKNFTVFYTEEDMQNRLPESLLSQAIANGRVRHTGWRVRKDGSRFWGSISITARHNKNGDVIGFIKVTRDLSYQKLLEESRRKYMLELENRSKEMEQLTYIASHDLQEPLRTIHGFTHLLADKCEDSLDEEGQMFMDVITQSVTRMQNLVKGILEYSLLGTDKTVSDIDCNQLVEDIKRDLSAIITAKKAVIEYEPLPVIRGYALELQQLFQNLINNAIKFSRNEMSPHINISVEKKENGWQFCIADNGIGIDSRYLHKIFQLFQRLNSRDRYEGTGIGLSYAKKIIELHDGIIWAESEREKGSRFYFLLSDIKPPITNEQV